MWAYRCRLAIANPADNNPKTAPANTKASMVPPGHNDFIYLPRMRTNPDTMD